VAHRTHWENGSAVCDGYLLVFYLWARRDPLAASIPDFPVLRAVAGRVLERRGVQAAFKAEGLAVPAV